MAVIGIICGSGLSEGLERILDFPREEKNIATPFGPVLSLTTGTYKRHKVILLPRHGKDVNGKPARSPAILLKEHGYEANIYELAKRGVTDVYMTSAAGSLEPDMPLASTGFVVIPNDIARGFSASAVSFGDHAKNPFPEMNPSFSPRLRENLLHAVHYAGFKAADTGLYIWNPGDGFETVAEIVALDKFYAGIPNRLVGMTVYPELVLGKQLGMEGAVVLANVNYAQGISKKTEVNDAQTRNVMGVAFPMFLTLFTTLLDRHPR